MTIEKIKKILRCGWALAPVEVEKLRESSAMFQEHYDLAPSPECGCKVCSLSKEVEQVTKERDYLVELVSKAAKWPKGCDTYAHAIGHIENVISNLRCDLSVEKKEVERLKSDITSLAQEFDSQHKMVASRYVAERLMASGSE
jgi:bacterioferritin (cytochrome b1)